MQSLRPARLIAILLAAAGSLGFLFHASHSRPPILMAIFVVWVSSPFIALILADALSTKWSALTRSTLHSMMLMVAIGSLAVYAHDAIRPRVAQAAFVYVMVPPASWLLTATALAISFLLSRKP